MSRFEFLAASKPHCFLFYGPHFLQIFITHSCPLQFCHHQSLPAFTRLYQLAKSRFFLHSLVYIIRTSHSHPSAVTYLLGSIFSLQAGTLPLNHKTLSDQLLILKAVEKRTLRKLKLSCRVVLRLQTGMLCASHTKGTLRTRLTMPPTL